MLTRDDVIKIAGLAKLNLSEAEIDKFLPQLQQIFDMAQMLEQVDTSNVVPIAQITGIDNMVYEDVPNAFPHPEKLLAQSPQEVKENMIKVKNIL